MKSIKSHSLALGIAFVGFTTQFGGGFASGAQIYQYFINYGIWGIVMPIVAQFLLSLFYWYGMKYAFRYKNMIIEAFPIVFMEKPKSFFQIYMKLNTLLWFAWHQQLPLLQGEQL